jgi:hypothetical protein
MMGIGPPGAAVSTPRSSSPCPANTEQAGHSVVAPKPEIVSQLQVIHGAALVVDGGQLAMM